MVKSEREANLRKEGCLSFPRTPSTSRPHSRVAHQRVSRSTPKHAARHRPEGSHKSWIMVTCGHKPTLERKKRKADKSSKSVFMQERKKCERQTSGTRLKDERVAMKPLCLTAKFRGLVSHETKMISKWRKNGKLRVGRKIPSVELRVWIKHVKKTTTKTTKSH